MCRYLLDTYNARMGKTTNAQRVAKARAALIERGGRQVPPIYLQPEAANALQELLDSQYAGSTVAAISKALIDACKNMQQSDER
jgi:hypothetical protein